MNLQSAYDYMDGVLSGKVVTGEYIRLAVERHFRDLDIAKDKGIVFDEKEAERYITFFTRLRHTKGEYAGKHFNLQPFQAFTLSQLYGWRRQDGYRRFRKLYYSMARKNGKTEMAAGIGLAGVTLDREVGAEVYFAATKADQARIGFRIAKTQFSHMRDDSDMVRRNSRLLKNSIDVFGSDSFVEYCSSEYDKMDGLNPHIAIIDEYHAHPTSGVLEVMETGFGARLQPLLAATTTAGFNIQGPCYALERVGVEILRGVKEDETFLPLIWTLDEEDDWNDPDVWVKPNPNVGQSVYWEYLHDQYKKAVNEGLSKEVQFRTKNLNTWTSSSSTWISDAEWMACGTDWHVSDLKGRPCVAGLDLAATRDLNALVLFFPGDPHKVICYFFCSEENAQTRTKNDGVNYMQWAADGQLTLTPGNVTDYAYIKKKLMDLRLIYNIRSIGYDPYNASQLVIELQDEGLPCEPFRQGFISMSAPTKRLEELVLGKQIDHGNNPLLRWQCGNVAISFDPAGNIKIDKKNSKEKVDGMVALVMAIGEWMNGNCKDGVYETRGVRTI